MNTWIFQGNPKRFNVDDYVSENETIWWSVRQAHLAEFIELNDEVFIWRSDGDEKGSGGIIARTLVIGLPQDYTNDEESQNYWYEDVSDDTYLAVELRVIEVDIEVGINRLELAEHEQLSSLKILRLRQNTNYLVDNEHKSYLKQLWYSRVYVDFAEIDTRFPLVDTLEQVKTNMKQFEQDLSNDEKLEKQLKQFQQWYYILDGGLLAPSKFIGYKEMKGHMYTDKQAIAGIDGRATVQVLKQWFEPIENQLLEKHIRKELNNKVRKDITINVLKDERESIERNVTEKFLGDSEEQTIKKFHSEMLNIYKESKKIDYTPNKLLQMIGSMGAVEAARKLINSNQFSYGFSVLAEKGRLDLTIEALILEENYRELFTVEERQIAKDRLIELDFYNLPELKPNNRSREYNQYPDEVKSQVVFEHLINNRTHRWLDVNVLERSGNTNGRVSANILYYLGLKGEYRGVFEGLELNDVIKVLEAKGPEYREIVELLKRVDNRLYKAILSDLEAERVEEGNDEEGEIKYYYGKRYERSGKNRKQAIEKHGLDCYVCGFNFEEFYGEHGKDFIEVHHIKPLSTLEEAVEINPETDLVPLCANCHRIVHRRKDNVLSIDDLKKYLTMQINQSSKKGF